MNKDGNNGLIIVGVILSALIVIRIVQVVILCKHKPYKTCKPCKSVKYYDDIVTPEDYMDETIYNEESYYKDSNNKDSNNKDSNNKNSINKESNMTED